MSITGINTNSLYELYGTQSVSSTSSTDSLSSLTGTGSTSSADSIDISKPAELFSKLKQLKETDPEKFKEVCSSIAEKLKSAAEEQGDSNGGNMLSDLADKFQNVADGGDISQLQPPPPPPGSGGMNGIQQYSQNDQSSAAELFKDRQSRGGVDNGMDQIMSSIMDEVNAALSDS